MLRWPRDVRISISNAGNSAVDNSPSCKCGTRSSPRMVGEFARTKKLKLYIYKNICANGHQRLTPWIAVTSADSNWLTAMNKDCPCGGTWTSGVMRHISSCPPNTCTDMGMYNAITDGVLLYGVQRYRRRSTRASLHGGRSTRAAPRGSLHGGRSTEVAPRGPLNGGVADLFYTDVRSILMVLRCISKASSLAALHFNPRVL